MRKREVKALRRNQIPWKGIVDGMMFALLLNQMSYVLTGQQVHEWTGTAMIFLIVCHNCLNRKWFCAIGKGTYNSRRLFGTILNFLTLTVALGLLISGVIMSRYVFDFLPIHGGRAQARRIHISCAYWGFLLMTIHIGMHWNRIKGKIRSILGRTSADGHKKWIDLSIGWLISAYGVYAFYRHEILSFLLLKNEFAIFNQQPVPLFIMDYLAMVILIVNLTSHFMDMKRKKYGT